MRNEALVSRVLKMVANTRSHWIIACAANMDPTEFANRDWVNKSKTKVKAPPQASATYCVKIIGEVEIRKTLDLLVVSESLNGKIEKADEVNEHLMSPHKSCEMHD